VDFPAAILPHKKINFAEMLMPNTPNDPDDRPKPAARSAAGEGDAQL
jgi:hypothetical protein